MTCPVSTLHLRSIGWCQESQLLSSTIQRVEIGIARLKIFLVIRKYFWTFKHFLSHLPDCGDGWARVEVTRTRRTQHEAAASLQLRSPEAGARRCLRPLELPGTFLCLPPGGRHDELCTVTLTKLLFLFEVFVSIFVAENQIVTFQPRL